MGKPICKPKFSVGQEVVVSFQGYVSKSELNWNGDAVVVMVKDERGNYASVAESVVCEVEEAHEFAKDKEIKDERT